MNSDNPKRLRSEIWFNVNTPAATPLASDTTTQGTWQTAYGKDGYFLAGDSFSNPGYAQIGPLMATIKVRPNGPLLVEGDDVKVIDAEGNEYPIEKRPFILSGWSFQLSRLRASSLRCASHWGP